jgi:hypothetical protein
MIVMIGMVVAMPVMARFSGAGCENGGSGEGDQPQNGNPQNAGGSQGCAKHKLPRSISILFTGS